MFIRGREYFSGEYILINLDTISHITDETMAFPTDEMHERVVVFYDVKENPNQTCDNLMYSHAIVIETYKDNGVAQIAENLDKCGVLCESDGHIVRPNTNEF